jgi:cytochrome c oxidase cbb3-type subunit IV
MDQNDLRTIVTVLGFLTFTGIVWWAWGRGRQQAFDEAAALPFAEDDEPNGAAAASVAGGPNKGKNHE